MKKLEDLNFHDRDSRIFFDESNHNYTIDKKIKATSVTQLIHKFFPEFDKEYWAEKESIKTGLNKIDILEKWKKLGNKARDLGTDFITK